MGMAQVDQMHVERLSAAYGLPNGAIKDIIQDRYGFLWFATREGIFRYDGYEFEAYRHDVHDSTSLSHPNVNDLYEDDDGNLWIGSSNGLNLLDRRTKTFQRFYPAPDNEIKTKILNTVNHITSDRGGNLWLGTNPNMLLFDKSIKQFSPVISKVNPSVSFRINCFFKDQQQNIWAGTSRGLLKMNAGEGQFQLLIPGLESSTETNTEIIDIQQDQQGTLWIATRNDLLKWLPNQEKWERIPMPKNLDRIPINAMILDAQDNVWLGIDENGLVVYNIGSKNFHHFRQRINQINSLNNNTVTCLLQDSYSNIWVGTENGICKISLDNSGFKLLQNEPADGHPANNIFRVYRDRTGTTWTKTPTGIYKIDPGQEQGEIVPVFGENLPGLGWDWFLEDNEGGLWFSVSRSGLYRKSPGASKFKKWNIPDSISNSGIYKMVLDIKDDHIIWLGTGIGLCRLNWKTLEHKWFRPREAIPEVSSNRVTIFEQFEEDDIWMYYTISNCIGRFNKRTQQFNVFFPPTGKESVLKGDIKDIAIGKDGNLWLATLYGLSNFNIPNKQFNIYGKREGMQENELQAVLIDENETVWVAGHRFFAQFDQRTNKFINYQPLKRIQNFQSKSRNRSNDGTISFGSINGALTFNPNQIQKNQIPPEVVLTDFKVKNKSLILNQAFEKTNEINLLYDQNDITFEFAGLHYINPSANSYRCQLIGYDDTWRDLETEHKISYTNLNHGQYEFRAIAANSDGIWNENGLSIQLTITPAFWQTNWFKGLIAMVVFCVLFLIYKSRQHQLKLKRDKLMAEQTAAYKSKFLAEVSHEIRTPMNAIIGLSDLTLESKLDLKQRKFVGAIQQSSKNLLSIINDLLDHSKLESGKFTFVERPFKLDQLLQQLKDTLEHKAKAKGLVFDIKSDPEIPNNLMGDPIRLGQILNNLLGNALKFTEKGKVWLTVHQMKTRENNIKLKFDVGDTGIGIPENELEYIFEQYTQSDIGKLNSPDGTGLGLSISKQLVEMQGGQIVLESEMGKGTKISFDLMFSLAPTDESSKLDQHPNFKLDALKVLIVEDTFFNQMLLEELLKKYIKRLKIGMAEHGKVALEKLAESTFDIVLMDVKMPVMDGIEATIHIRKSRDLALKNIPIIGITASAVDEQVQRCKDAGMNDVVIKPIDAQDLMEKIIRLTENK